MVNYAHRLILAFVLMLGFGVLAPIGVANAGVTVYGNMFCTTKNLQGIWIIANNSSHSGWAQKSPGGGHTQTVSWSYSGLSANESYKVSVGCGGTMSNWEVVANSGWVTGSHDFNCVDELNEGTILFYKTCYAV